MSTSTSASTFLGSDLSGMQEAPEGVNDLMEDWRQTAKVATLAYRIVTREVGTATMKRLSVRGLKSGRFLEVRVNPDCGGNDNCWMASVAIDVADFFADEKRLREAAEAINNRKTERKTPAPPQPKIEPKDPYKETMSGKEIGKIDAVIATKTKEAAMEIAAPMRSLLEEEAKKRGISFEAVLAELSA
jgi:hypothetical protein